MELIITKRTDPRLLRCMGIHYSHPKGFVGRNICYSVTHDGQYYGHIVAGSATLHLPARNQFFQPHVHGGVPCIDGCLIDRHAFLKQMVNNIFFHIEKVAGDYPFRNFGQKVLAKWRQTILIDWLAKYGDRVCGYESLVELPRTGEIYMRDGWTKVGITKGFTCKRVAGKGTDNWSGKRVWDTENLRPKLVFVRAVDMVWP